MRFLNDVPQAGLYMRPIPQAVLHTPVMRQLCHWHDALVTLYNIITSSAA
jgi:hypothetical protein